MAYKFWIGEMCRKQLYDELLKSSIFLPKITKIELKWRDWLNPHYWRKRNRFKLEWGCKYGIDTRETITINEPQKYNVEFNRKLHDMVKEIANAPLGNENLMFHVKQRGENES